MSIVAAMEAAQQGTDEEEDAAPMKPPTKRERAPKAAKNSVTNKLYSPAWNTSKFRGVTKHRRSGRWAWTHLSLSAHMSALSGLRF